MKLDATDQLLLRELRDNARSPIALLARRVGLSRTATQARITRLERDKVITGYTARTGEGYDKSLVQAHVMFTAGPKQAGIVEGALRKMPELRSLLSVSGAYDMVALVEAASIGQLDAVIDSIGMLEGVERTHTLVVLATRIQR